MTTDTWLAGIRKVNSAKVPDDTPSRQSIHRRHNYVVNSISANTTCTAYLEVLPWPSAPRDEGHLVFVEASDRNHGKRKSSFSQGNFSATPHTPRVVPLVGKTRTATPHTPPG